MLRLYDKFILLALDSKKGKFLIDSLALQYGLAGAILLELSEINKITINNKKIIIKDKKYTGVSILDACLKLINGSYKTRKARYWIYKIGNKSSGFKKIILNDLCDNQILRMNVKEYMRGLIKIRRYPLMSSSVVDKIKTRLRNVVINNEKPDVEPILLLSLMASCKLTRILFTNKKDHKASRMKIKDLTKNIEIGEAVSQTLKEIQAAIVVATSSTFYGS